jgi:hypothetical protein
MGADLLKDAVSVADSLIQLQESYAGRCLFSMPSEIVWAENELLKSISNEKDAEKLAKALDVAWSYYMWAKMNMGNELANLIYMNLCWPIAMKIASVKKIA